MRDRDWIDAVTDVDFEILGMTNDELEAFAYAHAEPLEPHGPHRPPRPVKARRYVPVPRPTVFVRHVMPHAA